MSLAALLPAALRGRRDVLELEEVWAHARVVVADERCAVLVRPEADGEVGWALGDPDALGPVLPGALRAIGPGLRWLTVPAAVPVDDDVLETCGLERRRSWRRMVADRAPAPHPAEASVVELDVRRDARRIRECLAVANPTTHARPGSGPTETWRGVPGEDDALDGVIAAERRAVGVAGTAVHLHGLGVRPAVRGRGLGAGLTAAAVRGSFACGAAWVSLGVYADNLSACRIYAGLGFRVEAENAGYGPPGSDRPRVRAAATGADGTASTR